MRRITHLHGSSHFTIPLTSEREIAADNGILLTYPAILGIRLSKKGLGTKFMLQNCSEDMELLKAVTFCGPPFGTLSMGKWLIPQGFLAHLLPPYQRENALYVKAIT